MKKYVLLFTLFLSFGLSFAQTKDSLSVEEQEKRKRNIEAGNPFKKFGYTPKIATLSKGKYLEWHDLDSIVRIGSYSFHVKKKDITGYNMDEDKNSESTLRPELTSRWLSPDPLAEEFPSWSPYNFVLNNPLRYTDPTGLAPEDIIRVNSSGYITKVTKAEGAHIVVDHNGNQLNLNDSSFDQRQLEIMIGDENFRYSADWGGKDRTKLFTTFSNKEMATVFNDLDIRGIKDNYETAKAIKWLGPPLHISEESYLFHLGHGAFDFADNMASVVRNGGNYNVVSGRFPPDGTGGFIKFENSNTLYNVYDAGNFMTGKAFNLIGVGLNKLLQGADLNSRATFNGADSKADQRAISNGFNYNGIKWKD